jgi:glycosyltransferase involved in cell wall biosynthesis
VRLLMITRRVDREDARTGFVHTWIERLAAHPAVERVHVICLEQGKYDLPTNVTVASMGKERGYGRVMRLAAFRRAMRPAVHDADVIFAHMSPRYALVAAPWALRYGLPLVLWYTHRHVGLELRLAHLLVDRVVTASPESFTLPSRKVTVVGHGIDMAAFRPAETPGTGNLGRLVAAIGRLSPIKHYDTLIEAAALLADRPGCEDVRFAIAGGVTVEHAAHADALHALVRERGLESRVAFLGPVPHDEIPDIYRDAALTVNLCPTGGLDKVVIESLASGIPALVHNETFLPTLGDTAGQLFVPDLDPALVADRLAALLSLPREGRAALGRRLASRVRAEYSLDTLVERLVAVFSEVIAAHKGRAAAREGRS